jgi:hypothetical protein
MNTNAFNQNVEWNLEQVAVQVGHAESVKGRARSGYYKAAIIITASIVEALAFKVLEKNKVLEMPLEDWECKNSFLLPKNCVANSSKSRLSVCERSQRKFALTTHTDFKKVNEVCLKLQIFSNKFFNKIERVRKSRNKIHIQGLDSTDRSYRKKELEFISSVMNELLNKL